MTDLNPLSHTPILLVKLEGVAAPWPQEGKPMMLNPYLRHALIVYETLNPGHVIFVTTRSEEKARDILCQSPETNEKPSLGFHSKAMDAIPLISCPLHTAKPKSLKQTVSGPIFLNLRKFYQAWDRLPKDNCPIIFMCDQPYRYGPDFEIAEYVVKQRGRLWQVTHYGTSRITDPQGLPLEETFVSEGDLGRELYKRVFPLIPENQPLLRRFTPAPMAMAGW